MAQMQRVRLDETWTDGSGLMAVLRKDGGYNIYVDLDLVDDGRGRPLSDHPKIRTRLNQALLSIINAKKAE